MKYKSCRYNGERMRRFQQEYNIHIESAEKGMVA